MTRSEIRVFDTNKEADTGFLSLAAELLQENCVGDLEREQMARSIYTHYRKWY